MENESNNFIKRTFFFQRICRTFYNLQIGTLKILTFIIHVNYRSYGSIQEARTGSGFLNTTWHIGET